MTERCADAENTSSLAAVQPTVQQLNKETEAWRERLKTIERERDIAENRFREGKGKGGEKAQTNIATQTPPPPIVCNMSTDPLPAKSAPAPKTYAAAAVQTLSSTITPEKE